MSIHVFNGVYFYFCSDFSEFRTDTGGCNIARKTTWSVGTRKASECNLRGSFDLNTLNLEIRFTLLGSRRFTVIYTLGSSLHNVYIVNAVVCYGKTCTVVLPRNLILKYYYINLHSDVPLSGC
jgi:hypothetical protein